MGDFNLDERKRLNNEYSHKVYYELLDQEFEQMGFIQVVNFTTWSRMVNGEWRESVIDHIYSNDATTITNLKSNQTMIGHHVLIIMTLNERKVLKCKSLFLQ